MKNRTTAITLTLLVMLGIIMAPLGVALAQLLLTQLPWTAFVYSTSLACIAAPFLYVMFRRIEG